MIDIIPAIDLIGGQCVRLRQGDYACKTVYDTDPVAVAKRFEAAGMTRLHLVDLDGAKAGAPKNLQVLQAIREATGLIIDFSGGLRSEADADAALAAGADFLAVGSLAVKDPLSLRDWVGRYGSDRIILGADVRDMRVAIDGWTSGPGPQILLFLEEMTVLGLQQVFCTDISRDGMLEGPAVALYRSIKARFPEMQLVASGGVRSLADVAALERTGCSGVIIGKALYEGLIPLDTLAANNPDQ